MHELIAASQDISQEQADAMDVNMQDHNDHLAIRKQKLKDMMKDNMERTDELIAMRTKGGVDWTDEMEENYLARQKASKRLEEDLTKADGENRRYWKKVFVDRIKAMKHRKRKLKELAEWRRSSISK